jgi:hypothetical protein
VPRPIGSARTPAPAAPFATGAAAFTLGAFAAPVPRDPPLAAGAAAFAAAAFTTGVFTTAAFAAGPAAFATGAFAAGAVALATGAFAAPPAFFTTRASPIAGGRLTRGGRLLASPPRDDGFFRVVAFFLALSPEALPPLELSRLEPEPEVMLSCASGPRPLGRTPLFRVSRPPAAR